MEIKWESPHVAAYRISRHFMHKLLQLPDTASIYRLANDYDRDCILVAIEHPNLEPIAEGEIFPGILPSLHNHNEYGVKLIWPDLEDKQG